jgi:hypothetical protein
MEHVESLVWCGSWRFLACLFQCSGKSEHPDKRGQAVKNKRVFILFRQEKFGAVYFFDGTGTFHYYYY